MKLTVIVQGYKGSGSVPAKEAAAFLVRGVAVNGEEIAVREAVLNITPGGLLTFSLRDAQPVGEEGYDPQALGSLWPVSDGSLEGSPLEIEFREAPQ